MFTTIAWTFLANLRVCDDIASAGSPENVDQGDQRR